MNPCAVPTEIKDIDGDNRWMSVVSKLLFKQQIIGCAYRGKGVLLYIHTLNI